MAGINIGSNAIAGGYLGSTPLVSAYIGADQIWSSGPFTGLTISKTRTFKTSGGTADIKVKSGADWTLATNDSWLTIGTASGTSGTSAVTITAATYTSETEDRTGYITATTSALSAVCTVTQKRVVNIVEPDNWDFLIVFQTTGANETVVFKTSRSRNSFNYYDGETGNQIGTSATTSYTFTNAGLHPVFYHKVSTDSYTSGEALFYSGAPVVYGVYLNSTYYTGKNLPKQMFYCEHGGLSVGDDVGKYLYIPEGVTGPGQCFSMYYFGQLNTLVIPSTFTSGWDNYNSTDWTFCGMARCTKVYNFAGYQSPSAPTMFGYNNVCDIGLSASTKTQYYVNGSTVLSGYGIRNFTGVEMAAGATMQSMGLSRTVADWWDEVRSSV